mmetsp:Transcript_19618/g.63684  ORF Transcript_19618/g.63684 Transcript_19618/m.63684 type:complete len:256 (+) Transcript_19618:1218-1985(+)
MVAAPRSVRHLVKVQAVLLLLDRTTLAALSLDGIRARRRGRRCLLLRRRRPCVLLLLPRGTLVAAALPHEDTQLRRRRRQRRHGARDAEAAAEVRRRELPRRQRPQRRRQGVRRSPRHHGQRVVAASGSAFQLSPHLLERERDRGAGRRTPRAVGAVAVRAEGVVELEHHASGLELLARLPERSGGGGEEAAERSGWPRREFDDVDDAAFEDVDVLLDTAAERREWRRLDGGEERRGRRRQTVERRGRLRPGQGG